MRKRQTQKPSERGVAAVEFAFVFPMVLATFFVTLSLGLGLFAKYEAWNFATNAARKCVTEQIPVNVGELPGCVSQQVSSAMSTVSGFNPCATWSSTSQIETAIPNNPNMGLLTVNISCQQQGFITGSFNLMGTQWRGQQGTYVLQVSSSMPYLNYQ